MDFNQELKVPDFINSGKTNPSGRELLSLSDIDVARDIMDVQFVSRNDDEGTSKEYFLSINDWTPNNLIISVNFTDPLSVSGGGSDDQIVCSIKNTFLFAPTASGGEPLKKESATNVESVPRQLPKGFSAEELEAQAASAGNAMKGLMVIQIGLAVFMKGAIKDLVGLFFTL